MSRLRVALAVLAIALGIFWSSNSGAVRERTSQIGRIESSPDKSGFAFEVLERSNPKDRQPTSTMMAWVYPHASGLYKNRSGSPPLHRHLHDDELFEIIEGTMGYTYEGKEGILKAGQKALLKAGKIHTFWNAEPETTLVQKFKTINTSGRHTINERFFESFASIAYDYGGLEKVPPLQIIVLFDYAGIEAALPLPVRLLVRLVAVPIGKLLGYKPLYPEYILP